MEIPRFRELLSAEEVQACNQVSRKTWYHMPLEVFTSFIFKVRISLSCYVVCCWNSLCASILYLDAGIALCSKRLQQQPMLQFGSTMKIFLSRRLQERGLLWRCRPLSKILLRSSTRSCPRLFPWPIQHMGKTGSKRYNSTLSSPCF